MIRDTKGVKLGAKTIFSTSESNIDNIISDNRGVICQVDAPTVSSIRSLQENIKALESLNSKLNFLLKEIQFVTDKK